MARPKNLRGGRRRKGENVPPADDRAALSDEAVMIGVAYMAADGHGRRWFRGIATSVLSDLGPATTGIFRNVDAGRQWANHDLEARSHAEWLDRQ